ncbi:hypothetical protein [Halorarum halobium]|uniref:hypothetical protein n=1 Tax=Halorarum halobium TaxID=3075121 RepID=UPI0028B0D6F6|nr:hypothetical protein [Halobaculum sp. XH14]
MALSDAQEAVLEELVSTVPADVRWCVFGSANLALRGLEADPSDVDVLTAEAGAARIRDALAAEFVGTGEVGVSQVDEYRIGGVELEVVYAERAKDHQEPLADLGTVELDRVRGVPILPPDALVETYRRMGKDETAATLEETFSDRSMG